jgi:hypothetical protein
MLSILSLVRLPIPPLSHIWILYLTQLIRLPLVRCSANCGITSDLTSAIEFIFLLWVLYRLLAAVSKTPSSLMVILG